VTDPAPIAIEAECTMCCAAHAAMRPHQFGLHPPPLASVLRLPPPDADPRGPAADSLPLRS
jgi:hypothetical protein